MGNGKNDVVVGRGKQIGQALFYPLVFFEGATKGAVPVATAVVLGVGVHAPFVAALVAMIPQISGVAMIDPREHLFGIVVFRCIITTGKQLLEGCFTAHQHQV